MNKRTFPLATLPRITLVAGLAVFAAWQVANATKGVPPRLPGADLAPNAQEANVSTAVTPGKVVKGNGQPGKDLGTWPQFRGANRDGISEQNIGHSPVWAGNGPPRAWSIDCGEGYAGAAVQNGQVFLMDYDAARKESAIRCLSLADGVECWRYAYPVVLKRNHGMTRTVPSLTDKYLVAMDPKCNLLCLDLKTGALRWRLDLVKDFGSSIPPWYTGQCPLIEGNTVFAAPGGPEALLLAVDLESGKTLWQSKNPRGWKMTHSSLMSFDFAGQHMLAYCASGGLVGVSAKTGELLWDTPDWKISIATVPSPLSLGDGKLFLSGGYNAGSALLQLENQAGKIIPKMLFKLPAETFGATQHTPILLNQHLYGTRPNGQFTCLDLTGKVLWTSPAGKDFGLGSYLLAGDTFLVLNDAGTLTLIAATPAGFTQLGEAKLMSGGEAWGPMALVNGRLLVRDLTHLACFDVSGGLVASANGSSSQKQ